MTTSGAQPPLDHDAPAGVAFAGVLARLDTLVDWERRDRAAGMRVSLEPMRDLLRRLDDPQHGRPLVHVTGTKGKGSTLVFVEAALREQGIATALFTSPHVESVCERLRLDGRSVAEGVFARALKRTLAARDAAVIAGTSAAESTWFDVVTAASALGADEARAEVWLVEVGLGGRLDSTNALESHVSAITSIELEHTAVLGTTRIAIAGEKAGIARAGRALVIALDADDPAALHACEVATRLGATVDLCPPYGDIDARNRRLAARLLVELSRAHIGDTPGVDWSRIQRAAASAADRVASGALPTPRLPGRLERWRERASELAIVLDGAHVPESLALVLEQLERTGPAGPYEVVFTCGRDKRALELLTTLAPKTRGIVCTELPAGRSFKADELAALAQRLGLPAQVEPDPQAAFELAAVSARAAGVALLATGSLHLLGPLRAALGRGAAVLEPG